MSEGSSKSGSDERSARARRAETESRPKTSTASRAITTATASSRSSSSTRSTKTGVSRRAVTTADDPAREGVRLGVIAFTTFVSFVGLLALGAIAGHVGADVWIGAGPMTRSVGETFVIGVRLPLAMLRALYASGVDDPLFFASAMALLIPPIAALVAARPIRPGEPRPTPAVLNAARLGAALVVAGAIAVGVRLANVARPTIADAMPGEAWLDRVNGLAASDAISMVFAILLAVLVFRLPVDRWVRALAGTIAIATAMAATVAAAASSGIAGEVERPHPMVRWSAINDADLDAAPRLLLGTTADGGCVLLDAAAPMRVVVEPRAALIVTGRDSIAGRLATAD